MTIAKTATREYRIWIAMIQRCTKPVSSSYAYYGGRGIAVCGRWANSFDAFLADMGRCPSGMSLDRINPDGNYEPANCRWATRLEQARNKTNTKRYDHDGLSLTAAEWAERSGVEYGTIRSRLRRGYPIAAAIQSGSYRDGQRWGRK